MVGYVDRSNTCALHETRVSSPNRWIHKPTISLILNFLAELRLMIAINISSIQEDVVDEPQGSHEQHK